MWILHDRVIDYRSAAEKMLRVDPNVRAALMAVQQRVAAAYAAQWLSAACGEDSVNALKDILGASGWACPMVRLAPPTRLLVQLALRLVPSHNNTSVSSRGAGEVVLQVLGCLPNAMRYCASVSTRAWAELSRVQDLKRVRKL
jgi:hypothetical protein